MVNSIKFNRRYLTSVDRTKCHGVRKRYHPVLQVSVPDRELIISLRLYHYSLRQTDKAVHDSHYCQGVVSHSKEQITKQFVTEYNGGTSAFSYTIQNTGTIFAHRHLYTYYGLYFHEQLSRGFLQPNSSMGFFVLLHEDFFSLFISPSFSYSVQFPAALLSLSFSLLHLSFLTHSRGVRFLQLVHISAPISRTSLPPSLSRHPFPPSFSSSSSSTSC